MVTSKRKSAAVSEVKSSVAPAYNEELLMARSYVDEDKRADVTVPIGEPTYRPEKIKPNTQIVPPTSRQTLSVETVETVRATEKTASTGAAQKEGKKENILTSSMKKMLVIYLMLAILLTVAVIATGVAINNVTADAAADEARIAELNGILAVQFTEIEDFNDDDFLRARGEAMGFVDNGPSVTIPQVEIEDGGSENNADWFDEFNDWMGGLI